jgi:deoxyribodipyrimidine photo-lyase
MSKKYNNGLFIFRRDLRIPDNKGLYLADYLCNNIYTIFIFTPEQVSETNKYKSDNSVQFMIESLKDLATNISKQDGKLYTFYGHNDNIITTLIKSLYIDCVIFNADYTPYAIKRDSNIIQLCDHLNVCVEYAHDYYLHEPGSILNGSKQPYQKFTPYYVVASSKKVDNPLKTKKLALKTITTGKHLEHQLTLDIAFNKFTKDNKNILVHGGRENGLKQLIIAKKLIANYSKTHNELSKETSLLSAYIKFGCVSIREVYHLYRSKHAFIRQLYWRDFYAQILFHFPQTLGSSLKQNYNKINWHYNANWFNKWTKGETGFPIVDAGMRQLLVTGYMHNRARLITSSFLVKTLLIDWQKGEQYFAQQLTDYDPASNNGNWQWTAGSGADSQPYFRIFNPWLQSIEHDPDAEYIKKWIPELKDVPVKAIHNWYKDWSNYKNVNYVKPILNYEQQKEKILQMYKAIF